MRFLLGPPAKRGDSGNSHISGNNYLESRNLEPGNRQNHDWNSEFRSVDEALQWMIGESDISDQHSSGGTTRTWSNWKALGMQDEEEEGGTALERTRSFPGGMFMSASATSTAPTGGTTSGRMSSDSRSGLMASHSGNRTFRGGPTRTLSQSATLSDIMDSRGSSKGHNAEGSSDFSDHTDASRYIQEHEEGRNERRETGGYVGGGGGGGSGSETVGGGSGLFSFLDRLSLSIGKEEEDVIEKVLVHLVSKD